MKNWSDDNEHNTSLFFDKAIWFFNVPGMKNRYAGPRFNNRKTIGQSEIIKTPEKLSDTGEQTRGFHIAMRVC